MFNPVLAALMMLVLTSTQFIAIFHHHTSTKRSTLKAVSIEHAKVTTLEKSCEICDLLSDSYTQVYHQIHYFLFWVSGSLFIPRLSPLK